MEKQVPPLQYISQRLVDRSGDRSGIPFITMTGKQLQKLLPPPVYLTAAAIRIAVAKSIAAAIAAASGAVPPETPLLTVNLWQIPSPGCWAGV